LDVLPLPLREGVGGGGRAYLAWPPTPLQQGEGEHIQSSHSRYGALNPHSLYGLLSPRSDSIES